MSGVTSAVVRLETCDSAREVAVTVSTSDMERGGDRGI